MKIRSGGGVTGALVALALGYVLGVKSGDRDLDQLSSSLKALYQTEEFSEVVVAARQQVGRGLRELAGMLDHHTGTGEGDLVAQVKNLTSRGLSSGR
ncbi:MAG: hypothetical protein ACRDVW_06475 [Acidimicrobiales bacterium]